MKKTIAILMALLGTMAAVADTSENSYFLWSFKTGEDPDHNPAWPSIFQAAALYGTLVSGNSDQLIWNVDPTTGDQFALVDASIGQEVSPVNILANLGTDPSIYKSFYLVAYGPDSELHISPTEVAFSDVQDYIYTDMGTAIDGNNPYVFTVIPEPSSGLLLLLGVAGLALKRKKMI